MFSASVSVRKGFTLLEVLLSIAILSTTAVLLLGYLYRGSMTQKTCTEDYGRELSKRVLLWNWQHRFYRDTILDTFDSLGNPWETILHSSAQGEETCVSAVSVRRDRDTTPALHFCTYGDPLNE